MRYARTPHLALALALTLVSCGGGSSTSAPPAITTDPVATAAAPAPAAAAVPAEIPTTPLAGTLGGNAFTAQDAVWVDVTQAASGGGAKQKQILLVAGDGNNLCQTLAAGTASPNAVLLQLGGAQPSVLPTVGAFPLVDPATGTASANLAANNSYSMVSFIGAAASAPVFATTGNAAVSAIDVADLGPLTVGVVAQDAAGDAVQGVVTAHYCAAAGRLAAAPGPSLAITNVNENIGSHNTNNNNSNNNVNGGAGGGGTNTAGAGATGATAGASQQPVIINININIGSHNTNNNNTNNNVGGGTQNNNNTNNNPSQAHGGLLGLLGL